MSLIAKNAVLTADWVTDNFNELWDAIGWVSAGNYAATDTGLNAALAAALSGSQKLFIPAGSYALSNTFGTSNIDQLEILCEDGAEFTAQAGFPSNKKMVQFILNAGATFIWKGGGYFDAQEVPNSGVGEANDCFSVNASGAYKIHVEGIHCYAGALDYDENGSDSGLFIGWATYVTVLDCFFDGFPDAGFYPSGGSGATSEVTKKLTIDRVRVNNCGTAVIPKRYFQDISIGTIWHDNCLNGVVIGGEADIAGTTLLQADNIYVGCVQGYRADNTLQLRYARRAHVGSVIGIEVGHKDSVTRSQVLALSGSAHCHIGSVHANGTNSLATGVTDFCGVTVTSRTVNSVTRNSTDNHIDKIYAAGLTRSVRELAASQDRNIYGIGAEDTAASANIIQGANCAIVYPVLSGSATFDPSNLADGAGETTTVTVTGAALGDFAIASFSLDLQGITLTAYVSAADTVTVRFQNESGGAVDLASGTLRAKVYRT